MSQEKVDRYKKEKANRAAIMKKEKQRIRAMKIGGTILAIVIVGWVGYSVYDMVYEEPVNTYSVDSTALDDYLSEMNAANAETESVDEAEDEEEAAAETNEEAEEETAAETNEETAEETAEETSEE
ncbi:MAG: hypothetical protein Q4F41_20245 [Eubacteriales bacterium]|nr:hypothetical protein [Eubacteriales bacterium]